MKKDKTKKNEIKEDVTIRTPNKDRYVMPKDGEEEPNTDDAKEPSEPQTVDNDRFLNRARSYWNDMTGIMELLNEANPLIKITDSSSPHVMNYLLWRTLMETKKVRKAEQMLQKDIQALTQLKISET